MNNIYIYLLSITIVFFPTQYLQAQDSLDNKTIFPEGVTIEYGIGSYAVTDEYISKEKYSGTFPYYSITWANQHSNYVYHLKLNFGNSSGI